MIEQVIIGIMLGVVFGLYGYVTKSEPDEPLNPRKVFRTAVVYGAAGAVVGLRGEPVTEAAIVEATALTAVFGEVADKAYSRFKRFYTVANRGR